VAGGALVTADDGATIEADVPVLAVVVTTTEDVAPEVRVVVDAHEAANNAAAAARTTPRPRRCEERREAVIRAPGYDPTVRYVWSGAELVE
jgi:hypothetical protein